MPLSILARNFVDRLRVRVQLALGEPCEGDFELKLNNVPPCFGLHDSNHLVLYEEADRLVLLHMARHDFFPLEDIGLLSRGFYGRLLMNSKGVYTTTAYSYFPSMAELFVSASTGPPILRNVGD